MWQYYAGVCVLMYVLIRYNNMKGRLDLRMECLIWIMKNIITEKANVWIELFSCNWKEKKKESKVPTYFF